MTNVPPVDALIRALADPALFDVLAHLWIEERVSSGDTDGAPANEQTDRHLKRLSTMGLIETTEGRHRVKLSTLLESLEKSQNHSPVTLAVAKSPQFHGCISNGLITQTPGNKKKLPEFARFIAACLPEQNTFTERQLMKELASITADKADTVTLRRLLIDQGVLIRTADGAEYSKAAVR